MSPEMSIIERDLRDRLASLDEALKNESLSDKEKTRLLNLRRTIKGLLFPYDYGSTPEELIEYLKSSS